MIRLRLTVLLQHRPSVSYMADLVRGRGYSENYIKEESYNCDMRPPC